MLRIVTPRTQVFLGYVAQQRAELGEVAISVGATRDHWATVGLTLLEGAYHSSTGGRGLIVATGAIENTHQTWKGEGRTTLGATWGDAPTLIETVPAEIELPIPASRVTAYALDEKGKRGQPIVVREKEGKAVLVLGGTKKPTLWYEFVIAAEAKK